MEANNLDIHDKHGLMSVTETYAVFTITKDEPKTAKFIQSLSAVL